MILLDTDHLTILKFPDSPQDVALRARFEATADQEIGTTIVSAEEQMRGWLAVIARYHDVSRQVNAYQELLEHFQLFSRWTIIPFTQVAADQFDMLRRAGVRIGTMDLKIASVALVHNALLLSANLKDFKQVPGLRVEDWLH